MVLTPVSVLISCMNVRHGCACDSSCMVKKSISKTRGLQENRFNERLFMTQMVLWFLLDVQQLKSPGES